MTQVGASDINGAPQSHPPHLQHAKTGVLRQKETASNSITAMTYRRRPQGAAKGTVALYTRVDPNAVAIVDQAAERVGVSKAEFVEALIFHLGTTLDESGVPTWWTKPIADDKELDLHAS